MLKYHRKKYCFSYSLGAIVLLSSMLLWNSCNKAEHAFTTIYLVRHAEKADASTMQNVKDPDLSEVGYTRAIQLAKVFDKASLDGLYSTNYLRTINTLKPISADKNLHITLYNPSKINLLLDSLMNVGQGKSYLISGHSNTVLPMISYLNGALPQSSIAENEYDKLFKVQIGKDTTIVVRTVY